MSFQRASAGGGGGAPTNAEYVVISLNGTLTNERVLTAGTGITLTDAGAGSTLTVATSIATTIAYKSSDQTLIGTMYTDVSGTGLSVAANTWRMRTP